jgi:hypothetical protein
MFFNILDYRVDVRLKECLARCLSLPYRAAVLRSFTMTDGIGIRTNTPRAQWRRGDVDAASALLTEQFETFLRAPDGVPVAGDMFTLEYIQMLLHRGFFRDAERLIQRVDKVDPRLGDHFYLLDKVTRFCLAHSNESLKTDDAETFFAVLPVWGDHYLEIWEQFGLPSFIDDAALCLYEGRRLELLVFTCSDDRGRLLAMPGMQVLARHASVRFFNLDVILREHGRKNWDAMNIACWATLTLAKKFGAGVLMLFGDTLYARDSIRGLDEAIRQRTHDILFTIDLQLDQEARSTLTATGAEKISSQDLVELFVGYPAIRELGWRLDVEAGRAPVRPPRLSRVTNKVAELRTFYPQPLYISADLAVDFFAQVPTGFDLCAVDAAWVALGGSGRMRVLDDPCEFLCATIDIPDPDSPWIGTAESEDPIGDTLRDLARRGLLGPARQWAFSRPLRLIKTDPDEQFLEMEARIEEFRGNRCLFHIDYLGFVKEAAMPVFDRLNIAN